MKRRDLVRLREALDAARESRRVAGPNVWDSGLVLDAYGAEAKALARLGREDEAVACWAEARRFFASLQLVHAHSEAIVAGGADRHNEARSWIYSVRNLLGLGRVAQAEAMSAEALRRARKSMDDGVIARARGQRARFLRLAGRADEVAAVLGAAIDEGIEGSGYFGAEAAYEAWGRGDAEEARRRLDYAAERHGPGFVPIKLAREALFPD